MSMKQHNRQIVRLVLLFSLCYVELFHLNNTLQLKRNIVQIPAAEMDKSKRWLNCTNTDNTCNSQLFSQCFFESLPLQLLRCEWCEWKVILSLLQRHHRIVRPTTSNKVICTAFVYCLFTILFKSRNKYMDFVYERVGNRSLGYIQHEHEPDIQLMENMLDNVGFVIPQRNTKESNLVNQLLNNIYL